MPRRPRTSPFACHRTTPPKGSPAPTSEPRRPRRTWASEFLTLTGSERVPIRWGRLFALAVYTFARAGELAALRWEDVDLDHETIQVHRSEDRVRKTGIKATKSETARRIPIEPELAPLLVAMRREAGGKGPVFRMPSAGVLSHKLKRYLERAGVERSDLFASDATRKAITFHDLRATGITWMAARGGRALADHATRRARGPSPLAFSESPRIAPGRLQPQDPAKNKAFRVELTGIEPTLAAIHN